MQRFVKDSDANLDYSVDWSDWLVATDEIQTSTWIVPTGLTQGSSFVVDGDTGKARAKATVWISGGTPGKVYRVTNRITTNSSPAKTDDRSFEIEVVNR